MDIYVGNFPWDTTEEELRKAFEAYGKVENVKIIMNRETGRSKGFGFVTMPDDNEAKEAIEQADGSDFGGRTVRVNEAKPLTKK